MASNPPGDCCTEVPNIHTGTPKGKIQKFANVDTYITHPTSGPSRRVILYLSDIMGVPLKNGQLVADSLAAGGYSVVMPDLFQGDATPYPKPATFNLQEWIKNHQLEHTEPIIDAVLAQIRTDLNPIGVGVVGYCFGGKYVVRLLGEGGGGRVDAGFTAHPSLVTMEELAAVKKPLSIAAAETDPMFPKELRHQSEDKLTEIGATYQINLYSHVHHGFSSRGDENNRLDRFAKEGAVKQALVWFDEYVPGKGD